METNLNNNNPNQLKKTILITEDQESNFLLLEVLLGIWGVNTIRACNAQEAVDICNENNKIDLVLMDIRLPDFSGLEATRLIKKAHPDLPIIAQTAYAITGDREKALDAGCNEYITKPIRREKLFELLERFLG
ncbi:MAG: response regulator [Bacteroidetes bacterium HGW-Bacteroidetes-17]|jgi:CheY-like chemotaxis protein|nr:MAG: response regulator [Bacteroidetes bacterium HGW-Bacteroidetes-17]